MFNPGRRALRLRCGFVGVPAPSGTVTFLFTDVVGSTTLWEVAPEAMRVAVARHDALLHAAIEEHDGYVFATGGDGFAAAFARAGDAVRAAVAASGRAARRGVARRRVAVGADGPALGRGRRA